MQAHTIPAGWLTLRPFTAADADWVYDVSQDPAVQHFVQLPSPYQIQHAAFFVHQVAPPGPSSSSPPTTRPRSHRHPDAAAAVGQRATRADAVD
jgi:hypothetical protein